MIKDLPGQEFEQFEEQFGHFGRPGFEPTSFAGWSWETERPETDQATKVKNILASQFCEKAWSFLLKIRTAFCEKS